MSKLSLFFAFLVLSCTSESEIYEYEEGLYSYLKNEVSLNLKNEEYSSLKNLFIINVDGCSLCVDISLERLSEIDYQNSIIVLCGETLNPNRTEMINGLSNRKNVLTDLSYEILSYETGIQNPYWFKLDDGIIIDFMKLDELNWVHLSNKLLENE